MVILVILALLVIATAISMYVNKLILRAMRELKRDTKRKRNRYIVRAVSIILGIASVNLFSFSAMVILHFLLMSAIVELLNFVIKKDLKIWKKIYAFSIIPFICTAVIMAFGYINLHNIQMTQYTVYTEKDIRPEGYTVALIADVHYGVSVDKEELTAICNEIGAKDIDIVVLCGDIVDDNTSKDEMKEVFSIFSTIENTSGIYYVYGNHDRQRYRADKNYSETELESIVEQSGIEILQDTQILINDDFAIIGREDASSNLLGQGNKRHSIDELLTEIDKNRFILVADHQPKEYAKNAQAGADLVVSGHTHGGQIWPVNIIDNLFKINEANYGFVQIDKDTSAIVTSGFAGWNYPIKTAAPAEYVIINVTKG